MHKCTCKVHNGYAYTLQLADYDMFSKVSLPQFSLSFTMHHSFPIPVFQCITVFQFILFHNASQFHKAPQFFKTLQFHKASVFQRITISQARHQFHNASQFHKASQFPNEPQFHKLSITVSVSQCDSSVYLSN